MYNFTREDIDLEAIRARIARRGTRLSKLASNRPSLPLRAVRDSEIISSA
jgi:hypothetical protein